MPSLGEKLSLPLRQGNEQIIIFLVSETRDQNNNLEDAMTRNIKRVARRKVLWKSMRSLNYYRIINIQSKIKRESYISM